MRRKNGHNARLRLRGAFALCPERVIRSQNSRRERERVRPHLYTALLEPASSRVQSHACSTHAPFFLSAPLLFQSASRSFHALLPPERQSTFAPSTFIRRRCALEPTEAMPQRASPPLLLPVWIGGPLAPEEWHSLRAWPPAEAQVVGSAAHIPARLHPQLVPGVRARAALSTQHRVRRLGRDGTQWRL